jgi:hypothetical protein
MYVSHLVLDIKGRTQADGVQERCVREGIWTKREEVKELQKLA